jgi:hypothetical protein
MKIETLPGLLSLCQTFSALPRAVFLPHCNVVSHFDFNIELDIVSYVTFVNSMDLYTVTVCGRVGMYFVYMYSVEGFGDDGDSDVGGDGDGDEDDDCDDAAFGGIMMMMIMK